MTSTLHPTGDGEVFSPIRWQGGELYLLDQTLLPDREEWILCDDVDVVADAIRRLAVRGAPAIGVAAAYGLVVGLRGAAPGADLEGGDHVGAQQAQEHRDLAEGQ